MKQGNIVLIPFPFTDLTVVKTRPALIISNEKFNKKRNLILMAISTKTGIVDFAEQINQNDLEEGVLNKTSFCRAQNVFTLEKRLIIKNIGKLKYKKLKKICDKYKDYFTSSSAHYLH